MRDFLKRNWIGLLGLVMAVTVLGSFALVRFIFPRVILAGELEQTLTVGVPYEEKGCQGRYRGHRMAAFRDGEVDSSKPGDYVLTYYTQYRGHRSVARRLVHVVDDRGPVIELVGGCYAYVSPGTDFEEMGYKALDNLDGDLTDKVRVVRKNEMLTYQVQDAAGNKSVAYRFITRHDTEAPVLILNGEASVEVTKGSIYQDPGCMAVDLFDKDIASKVVMSSDLDTKVPGDYVIRYEARDTSGNLGMVERKVTVVKPAAVRYGGGIVGGVYGADSRVYLTFDDGPSSVTGPILDILAEEGVKATFFVMGAYKDSYGYLWQRMIAEGHAIGIHCDSHDYSRVYASDEAFFNDLLSAQAKVREVTGVTTMLIRFPGGSSNKVSLGYSSGIMSRLVESVQARGFHYFDWNVASGDTGPIDANDVYNNVVGGFRPRPVNIVLMHDRGGNQKTLQALRGIIRYGKDHGYVFDKITMDTPQVHHSVQN